MHVIPHALDAAQTSGRSRLTVPSFSCLKAITVRRPRSGLSVLAAVVAIQGCGGNAAPVPGQHRSGRGTTSDRAREV